MPEAARETARFQLGKNVVVEAGAGTGKTTLLTDRIFHALLAGGPYGQGVAIDRLVAVTFTNKAAGEIKERVSSLLLDVLSVDQLPAGRRREEVERRLRAARSAFGLSQERIKAKAQKAVEDMDQALFGTIHHFAANILRLFPLEAGLDPNFTVDMGEGFRELFDEEWRRWLAGELGEDAPARALWLEALKLATLSDLKALAEALCVELPAHCGRGASSGMKARLQELAQGVERLRKIPVEPGGNSMIRPSIEEVSKRLEEIRLSLEDPLPIPDEAAFAQPQPRSWPAAWREIAGEDLYLRCHRFVRKTSGVSESLVRRCVDLVDPFSRRVKALYTRRGLVSNEGLISKALALVRGDKDARRELKERFGAILVDEFQDTDPLQGEILLFLAEQKGDHARHWSKVRLEPGKLFVVGDPKQSIYRFRGADMRAYAGFTGLMRGQGAEWCALQRNFRSRPELIAPVNAVFERLMKGAPGLQPEYVPILPETPDPGADSPPGACAPSSSPGAGVTSLITPAPGERRTSAPGASGPPDGPAAPGERRMSAPGLRLALVRDPAEPCAALPVDECRAAEARWIAEWIGKNVGPGAFAGPAVAQAPGERRTSSPGLRYKDVAILFRVTTSINVYLQALKEAGIPYAVEAERYFYGTQEIVDFTNLLKAIDDPDDAAALIGLLRSPLAGIPDQEICALRRAGRLHIHAKPKTDAAGVSPSSKDLIDKLLAMLRRLGRFADQEPLDDFVSRVFSHTFLLELCAAAYHHEQTASNLLKLKKIAKSANDLRGATLKEFIGEAARAAEDPSVKEGESPLADESYDAVRLLSIHKAKGLEYRVVILPDMRRGRPGDKGQKSAYVVDWAAGAVGLRLPEADAADAAMAFIEEEEAERVAYEAIRQLYVGMTRAKDSLILLGGAALRRGEADSFARTLQAAGAWPQDREGLRPADDFPAELEMEGGIKIPVEFIDKNLAAGAPPSPASGRPASGMDAAALARAWKRRFMDRARLEATRRFVAPTDYLDEPEKSSLAAADAGEVVLPSPGGRPAMKEEAALIGEVCHRVLETWDFKAGGDLPKSVAASARALSRAHPVADWPLIGREAGEIIGAFLGSSAAKELAAARILGRELHFIMPCGPQVMRGSIDVLYRHQGRLWVADYKTDGRGRDKTRDLYRRQGAAYVDAVRRALGEPAGFKLLFLRDGESLVLIEPD
ncbi:MAG: UvrD-helicase domain-containing protein [Elusimicrobia bacterium]|nr:UvrD-helicase domain-containing protein [Elusimicrobiota bacterium]